MTDEQLVTQVISDVKTVLNGGQWLLSFYAPFKDRPAIPGFSDLCFEEARLFIYEAKANNNVEQAVSCHSCFSYLFQRHLHNHNTNLLFILIVAKFLNDSGYYSILLEFILQNTLKIIF